MSPNDIKLRNLLVEILLIEDDQYRDENGPDAIETWDSLAMVRIAVEVERAFGYGMSPEEMVSLESIGDVKAILRSHDIRFDE
jgi:Phosphopantetheine attachment site.